MNWKRVLFRPRWQHKDASVRLQAVQDAQDTELLEVLNTLVHEDESAAVRAAAARRLHDLTVVVAALGKEKDSGTRDVLAARLRQLMLSDVDNETATEQRLKIIQENDDRDMLEAVAAAARDTRLRKAALARCERQGFLGDRAINDPDPDVRALAAASISQASTLHRVIDGTRTTDKRLHTELLARLQKEQLTARDPEAITREAISLCEMLEEKLIRNQSLSATQDEVLRQRWEEVQEAVPTELKRRFDSNWSQLHNPKPAARSKDQQRAPQGSKSALTNDNMAEENPDQKKVEPAEQGADSEALRSVLEKIRKAGSEDSTPGERDVKRLSRQWATQLRSVTPSSATRELDAQAQSILHALTTANTAAREATEKLFEEINQVLDAMEAALDKGALQDALQHRSELLRIQASLPRRELEPGQKARWNEGQGRLRELRDWQHWANDKIRKRLISEMEALPRTSLHPDAMLERIKQLQTEWKALEASEQIPGDRHYAAAHWMRRKFNTAGQAAFQHTKPFLDKRSEVQDRNLSKLLELVESLREQANAETVDRQALSETMVKTREAMRSLSSIPARQRSKAAAKLREALELGQAALSAHYALIEKNKLRLVREAAQLAHIADHSEAIAKAKKLQQQWKKTGRLWQKRENELWREFRIPIDPLFKRLEDDRKTVQAEQDAIAAEQQALLDEMASVLEAPDDELGTWAGKVRGLEKAWSDFPRPIRAKRAQFDRDINTFHERVAQLQRDTQARARVLRWKLNELLHRAEESAINKTLQADEQEALRQSWKDIHASAQTPEPEPVQRFEDALSGNIAIPTEEDLRDRISTARSMCIQLEFLAGLPSPESERDQRMEFQVQRLSDTLSGEKERISARKEAAELETAWLGYDYLPETEYAHFTDRMRSALKAINEGK